MDKLKKMLLLKEQQVQTVDDKEKISNIKFLLQQEEIFFRLNPATAISILEFLGVPEEEIRDYYLNLISATNFVNLRNRK